MTAWLPGRRPIFLALALLAGFLAGETGPLPTEETDTGSPPGSQIMPSPLSPAQLANAQVRPDWMRSACAQLAESEYHATEVGGGLQAPNRVQNLRTHFGAEGLAIEPRVAQSGALAWRFGWETATIGRPGRMNEVAPVPPHAGGSRVTYERPGWSEWYENTAAGVEQGFTLEGPLSGDGPLRITGKLVGMLRAQLTGGTVDIFDAHGACVLRYEKLVVRDATGRRLPSWLALADRTLAIEVDDRDARYPITIDPLMTSPAWTAEANQNDADLGYSISTAGDVNGDGYSDVIVGAPSFDNGQLEEGRAFVFHGSAAGLAFTPAWTAESNQVNAFFGFSVATAGDVNRDGYSDVIVGAWAFDNGQTDEGRAFVYHGSATGLATSSAWRTESNQVGANFGQVVGTAGDVNADGYSDVLVVAPNYDNGQTDEGRVFVFHGGSVGLATTPAWTGETNQDSCTLAAASTAGDVNADGCSDIICGAYDYDNGELSEGRVFVYHGSSTGLISVPAWTAESNQNFAQMADGAAAGDVNGDGFGDVIVGARLFDNGQVDEGRVFVYYGAAGGLGAAPAWTVESNQAASLFGDVATAGDVNGDGFADVVIGSRYYSNGEPSEGRAFVYLGSAQGLFSTPWWTAESNQANAWFGQVATAGDVNGDGFSDVIVGAPEYSNGQASEGKAFVYHGGSETLSTDVGWFTVGGQAGAGYGWLVATAGDVNGDGISDILAVANNYDNGQFDEGKVWTFHGSRNGLVGPVWSVETNQQSAGISAAVCAGDVNGDYFSDVLIGSAYYDDVATDAGRVDLYLGSPAGLLSTPHWTTISDQASAWYGWSASSAGDVNGDGYGDYIVGAPGWDNGQNMEGRASLYLGNSGGLALVAWEIEGNQDGAQLGYAVGAAGDVNRDGFSDVIVGLPTYDHGEANEGVAWVFHGTTGGLGTTPARVLEPDLADATFGSRVTTAGDVNGDGYSDVILGATGYTHGQELEGRAFVYHGGPGGLASAPAWTTEPDQALVQLGRAIDTAGDVNGDGFSDVVVGAPFFDNGQNNEGAVWLYHGSPNGLGPPVWMTEGNQSGAVWGISVGTAGDVNGDGFSDVLVGAPDFDWNLSGEGLVALFMGNYYPGLQRTCFQWKAIQDAPVNIYARSDSPTAFRVEGVGRTPAGSGNVRLQIEAKPLGTPFNGAGLVTTPLVHTASPNPSEGSVVAILASINGLTAGRVYHWRLRIATDSPFFPRSPWLWLPYNGATEGDIRTGGTPVEVSEAAPVPPASIRLSAGVPNPFRDQTHFQYALPGAGAVRLAVYNAQGRCVRDLVDGRQAAGQHSDRWDGRSESGRELPAGVYFLRLEFADQVTAQKLVLEH